MTPSGPAPGSRGNGLHAARYAAVGDLDPRIADDLLDTLRSEGIAGYVVPTPGHQGGYLDVRLPTTPSDRLYVDDTRAGRARELLQAELGEGQSPAGPVATPAAAAGDDLDVESRWADLVRGLQSEDDGTGGPWPDAENLPARSSTLAADTATTPPPLPTTAGPRTDAATRLRRRRSDSQPAPAYDPLAEEHFVPPAPPPVPRLRLATVVCLLTIALGIVLLSVNIDGGSLSWVGVLALLAGAAGLVHQVRQGPRDDDHDGAIV